MSRPRKDVPWLDTRHGVYYAFWYDRDERRTKRVSLRTEDPQEATRRFSAFLSDDGRSLTGTRFRTGADAGLTVREALAAYLADHVEPHVKDKERPRTAAKHLIEFMGDELLVDVDIAMSRQYLHARTTGLIGGGKRRANKAGRPATVKRELTTLVAAANHAVRWKLQPAGAVPTLELPKDTRDAEEGHEVGYLTKAEVAALMRAADAVAAARADKVLDAMMRGARDREVRQLEAEQRAAERLQDFIPIAYYTAARRASIERLTWFQVDRAHRRINLAKKGEQRTKKRRPIVPIDPALDLVLDRCTARRANEYVLRADVSVYRGFVALAAETLGRECSPHILRHSRATHLLQEGRKPWAVASLLGDTLTTVLRVYGHHCPDYLLAELADVSDL